MWFRLDFHGNLKSGVQWALRGAFCRCPPVWPHPSSQHANKHPPTTFMLHFLKMLFLPRVNSCPGTSIGHPQNKKNENSLVFYTDRTFLVRYEKVGSRWVFVLACWELGCGHTGQRQNTLLSAHWTPDLGFSWKSNLTCIFLDWSEQFLTPISHPEITRIDSQTRSAKSLPNL